MFIDSRQEYALLVFNFSRKLMAENKLNRAVHLLNKAIEISPEIAMFYSQRGVIFSMLSLFADAVKSLDQAIKIGSPDQWGLVAFYFNRSTCLGALGKLGLALSDIMKAVSLAPTFSLAWAQQGSIYLRMGLFEKAVDSYDAALLLEPKNPFFLHSRGWASYCVGDFYEALSFIEGALRMCPPNNGNMVLFQTSKEKILAVLDSIGMEPAYETRPKTARVVH